ncbi:hypothetical protein [Nonomuraea rhodomycinica]|uniref:hypothetical protein n=1 Tax=Nonomuraea rhodomycinica TaxID=1712872 RepID=UPI001C37BDB8|nr:hypothetical protein [Nonomuraea rhodomycinica]
MPDTVVEIHVPLQESPGGPDYAPPFPWIDEIEEFLFEMEQQGHAKVFDDGEEFAEVYVFFIAGAAEDALLAVASRVAALDGCPTVCLLSSPTTKLKSSAWDAA